MDDKYIKDIYDNLGGESVFGNYNDYYSLITSDDSYIKDVYDSKGESVFGSYDDFVSLVKKKDDSVVSTSQEGVTESTTKEEKTPTSLESSDVTVDIPTLEEEEEFELYIPDAPYREGVLSNEDGSVSTHKMRTETDGQGNWFSFPTVFQNKDGSFVDMSNQAEQDWSSVYEVAQNRDEVIDFGDDKESAIAYGKGSWKPIYDANKNIQLLDSVGYIEANEDFRSLGLEGISDFDKERLESREKSYRLKNPETGEIQYKKESQIKPEIIEAIKIYETSRDDSYKKNYTDVQVDVEDFDRDDVPDASKLDSLGINQEDYLKWDKVNTRQEGSVFKFMKRLLTSEEGDEFEKEQRQYEKLQSYQATQLNGITNDLEKNQAKQKLTSNPEKIKVLKKEEKNLQKEFYSKVQVMSRAIDLFPKFKEKTVDKDLEKRKRLYSAVKEGGLNETSQGTIELLRAGGTALSDFSINFLGGIPAIIDQRLATIGYDKKGFLAGLSDMFTDSAEHVDLEYGAVKRSGFMSGKPVTYRGQQYFVDKNGKVYDTETNILMDGIIPLSDVKEIQKRSKDVPEEETMWTGGSVATGLTSTLVNLFGLIITANRVKNTLGLKGKRAGSIGMGITSFTSGVVDNVDDIRSQLIATGMSEKEAMDIAVNAGQAISTLDGIFSGLAGSNEKLLTGLTGIKNQIKNLAITKGKDFTTKEFKRKFSELIKENGKELFVEELPVLFSEKGINYLVNRSIGQNVLDSKITKENIIETAVMTLGATSILGSRKLLSGNNRADLVRTIAADIGDLQGTLDALVKEGSLTKKEASNAYTEIYSMQTAENLTKGTILVSENMETASDLLIQRQKLINQKEGLEGPGKQNIDNKIADVDAQLDALYKKDKQEAEDIINKTKTDEDSIQEQKTDAEPAEGVQEVEAEVREPFVTEKKKEKISDALNRPITLTDLGGSKLDTPIEGDMYVDGQRVVVEDADGNITEIGNVDEISDSTLEDMGIVPQESDVKTDSQGNLIVGEDTLLPNKKGIKRDKRGNISRVVLQSPDGSVTRTLRGANAEDAAYQILLKEAQSPEKEQRINELLEQDEEFQNELRQAEAASQGKTDQGTEQTTTEGAEVDERAYKPEEVKETTDTAAFAASQQEAIAQRVEDKLQVTPVTQEDAQDIVDEGGKLFMTEDGKAGAYVKKDGYMGGLFKQPGADRTQAAKVLQDARIEAGGKFFDAFGVNVESGKGTNLEDIYIKNGFRPIARMTFNPEFAPKGWEKTNLKNRPDNVFFVYDPGYKAKKGEGQRIEDYEQAYELAKNFSPESAKVEGEVQQLRDMFKAPSQRNQVDNALNALSKIAPDVEVILHESEQAYAEATGETGRKQKTAGTYDETVVDGKVKKVIHINPEKANARTVAHESFHAIFLNMVKTDAEAQRLSAAMIKAVYKSAPAELKKLIDNFAESKNADGSNNYDSALQNEEKLAELIGYLATEYDSLPKPTKSVIKRFLDRLAKMFGMKPFTDSEVIDVLNTIAKKVSTGEAITEQDVKILDKNKSKISNANKRFQANFYDSFSGMTYMYDKNTNEFKQLKKDGYITTDKSITNFNGKYVFFHQPDAAFSGIIAKNGEILVEGKGGMYYPIKFHKDGFFWASTDGAAQKMAEDLNKVLEQNGGTIFMALTSAPYDKLLSSTTMSNAVLDFFTSKMLDNNFKLSEAQLKRSLLKAAKDIKIKKIKNKKTGKINKKKVGLGLNINKNSTVEEIIKIIKEALGPKVKSFGDRKNFTTELIKLMSNEINKNELSINQFGKLFSEGIKNKYFKGVTKTGKLKISATNMVQALSEMFTEPILKDNIDRKKGGQIYAILEVNGKLKPVPSDKHESYPKALKSEGGVKINILTDRVNWSDVTEDFQTNEIVSKDRKNKIYPTSGVSVRGLKINTSNISDAQSRKQKTNEDILESKVSKSSLKSIIQSIRMSNPYSSAVDILTDLYKGNTVEDFNYDYLNEEDLTYDGLTDLLVSEEIFDNKKQAINKLSVIGKGIVLKDIEFKPTTRSRKQFIGVKAKLTADQKSDKKKAEDMIKKGVDPTKVKQDTGFEVGTDGKLRLELDTSKAKEIGPGLDNSFGKSIVNKVLDFPKLFKAYPFISNIPVYFNDGFKSAGLYDGENIRLNSRLIDEKGNGDHLGTLLHEIQHVIQIEEGFTGGGNPAAIRKEVEKAVRNLSNKAINSIQTKVEELTGIRPELTITDGDRKELIEVYKNNEGSLRDMLSDYTNKNVEDVIQTIRKSNNIIDARKKLSEKFNITEAEAKLLTGIHSVYDMKLYEALSGEVEARNVQNRRTMTKAERRKSLAAETETISKLVSIGEDGGNFIDVPIKRTEQIRRKPTTRSRKQIIGENAELSDNVRENLSVARQMEKAGESAKTIRIATGWEKGADGKFRYEIDDVLIKDDFSYKNLKRIPSGMYLGKLSDVIDNQKLFKSYSTRFKREMPMYNDDGSVWEGAIKYDDFPPISDIKVYFREARGGTEVLGEYDQTFKTITINIQPGSSTNEQISETLLHEVQHYIQSREGWQNGGNLDTVVDKNKYSYEDVEKRLSMLDEVRMLLDVESYLESEKGIEPFTSESSEILDAVTDIIKKDVNKEAVNIYESYKDKYDGDGIDGLYEAKSDQENSYRELFNEYLDIPKRYKRLAGEVEARNVQKRRDMTPEQRRKTTLQETENVAREDQIFFTEEPITRSRKQIIGENADLTALNLSYSLNLAKEIESFLKLTPEQIEKGSLKNVPIDIMFLKNKTPEELKYMTGWERGKDNKWRYEIPDGKLTLRESGTFKLSDVYDSKDLYKAYPQLKDMKVEVDIRPQGRVNAWFTPDDKSIEINAKPDSNVTSLLVHEIQHAIQFIEGFAIGGNMMTAFEAYESTVTPEEKTAELDLKEEVEVLRNLSVVLEMAMSDFEGMSLDEVLDLDFMKENLNALGLEEVGDAVNVYEYVNVDNPQIINKLKKDDFGYSLDLEGSFEEASFIAGEKQAEYSDKYSTYALYQRLAGEVESRNAEKRYGMREEKRRETLLEATEDVAREDQILLFPKEPTTRSRKQVNLAPNGKPSNLNQEQYDIVRTPEFKNWFGDWENDPENSSKVVDENGEPLVVYHGSTAVDIDVFDRSQSKRLSSGLKEFGTYFATNKKLAELYKQGDGRVYPIFLNIRDMVTFDAKEESNIEAWNNLKVKASYKTATNRDAMEFLSPVISKKRNLGRFGVEPVNGIKAENIIDMFPGTEDKNSESYKKAKKEYLGNVYLLFDGQPENAKLADGSNTTFDPDAPSIRKQAPGRPSIGEIFRKGKENMISDAAIRQFAKGVGYTDAEITAAMNIPSSEEIVERSEKAIRDRLKKKDFKGTMRYLRKKIFDRQTYIKDVLKGVGNKKSVRAHNRLVTKAGAKGFANYRFKKAEREIFSKLSEKEKKQLDSHIYARRIVAINENRKKRDEKEYIGAGGYNYDKAKSEVEAFSNDKLSKRADKYFEVFNQNLKRLRDSGRISEDVYISLRDIEYSPIKTIKYIIGDNHSTSEMNNLANSIGVSQKDIMALSDENINDLITDSSWLLMMNISAVENRAATNEVLNLFYDAIESADADGLAAIGDNILDNPIIGNKESGAPKFKYDDAKVPVGYRTVSFFKDGVEHKMVMREEYARQLLDIKVDDKTLKALRKFTFGNVLRFFATSGNPLFIVGNTAVDFQNILFLGDTYSKFKLVGGVELGFDFVNNSLKKMFNTGSYQKTYEEFMTYGGGMDFLSVDGIKAIKGVSRFNKPKTLLQKGMVKWGEGLSYLGETSEMAFRLAVYEKTRSKLINQYKKDNKKEPTGQDLEDILYESARESRETIDFSQGGDLVKSADYVLPYLNASVQGARRAVDYASKNPGGFASSMIQYAVMSGGLLASSLYMLSSAFDDEDDEEEKAKKMKDAWGSVSDYEKSAYHIIFTGDVDEDGEYEYYRFKKLPVVGSLSTIVEESIISTYLKSKGVDYEFNTESVSMALDKTSPIGITDIGSRNPVISGVLSYVYNKDTFTGEDIFRGPRGKKILPEAEGILDNKVEQIYKDIAPALGMSPKRTQVMVEKVITNEKTNPLVGVMYGAYNGVFSKETTVGEEMKETMNGVLKSFSGKIKRSTNSKLQEYKKMDEVKKVEAEMETEIYIKEQKVYNAIKEKRKNKEDIDNGFLGDIIKENFDKKDWKKYGRKFSTYAKNANIDRSILDLIYEDTPEVQAYKIFSRYGDALDADEKEELKNAIRSAKRKLNKKALSIYNKEYRKK